VRNKLALLGVVALLGLAIALIIWRGPDWHAVHDAFTAVSWSWVFVAVALNFLSILLRSVAWDTAIRQSVTPPTPSFSLVFSAFSVGLFANAVLPGRVGELARVAVLRRRMPGRTGVTATLIGSVFAHRMFDLFPAIALVIWVLLAAKIPGWAFTSLAVVLVVGTVLFLGSVFVARRQHRDAEGLGRIHLLIARARQGLAVMRAWLPALKAGTFQVLGWTCQLFAVYATMYAFQIHEPLAAAGLVLVLMNVATIFPIWPGNVGLVQIAVATPLVGYGVAYAHGIAFGIGLQAIEASVGIGIGMLFLAREGISYAMLKQFEEDAEDDTHDRNAVELPSVEPERERARSTG
jgi:uncharacterized membrane protein YbhN (UPF0104 family)